MSRILEELGPQIRKLRAEKGLTQQELAEKSDLSVQFINFIENNKRKVSLETLVKLLDSLEISLSEFFLPYSDQVDAGVADLLLELQGLPNRDTYIKIFREIIRLER
ncbi:hypothetical protein STRDD10_00301 [Streptococcus sp. DD10]|uniref:helix-turn-helix domain-containing protein n=1 Tax=Streptococcus sp. DD10 TaxID=1777878 RepID=UPI00079A0200|nr:helix-turn-helix transcriptional regulator [Streptococcus sp. DD10]KXT76238.1 hypothetical protein STRDD10_00301 [Streptococcus sp. DD10]